MSYIKPTQSRNLFYYILIWLISFQLGAQEKDSTSNKETSDDKKKTIEELIENHEKLEGLFTFYRNEENGEIHMVVRKDQLDKDFIHFAQIADGASDALLLRGMFRDSRIFRVVKYFDRLDFVLVNTNFYFDKENALSNSEQANISNAIAASVKIEASDDKTGDLLIKANNLFLQETFVQIKPPKNPNAKEDAFSLGKLDDSKSKFIALKNYPENSLAKVEYVYSAPSANPSKLSNAVADGRSVSVKVYHNLIEVPENDYEPRVDDPRVGYFLTNNDDKTSVTVTPYRDLIHRWNLKKKDPSAEVSEPVEPIVWWMENTTPIELRPIIKKGAEQWNLAFEAAGFKNALVVKQQPDDATWDAGDIRYNVLRWTSSPDPFWGGYGPSFVNPLTGEILGADIMLEFRSVAGMLRLESLFETAGIQQWLNSTDEENFSVPEMEMCTASMYATMGQFFGVTANLAFDTSDLDKSKMINEFLYYLILHEIGHTLGLNHNMKSSQYLSLKDIHNEDLTSEIGLTGSVMDYPSINYNADRKKQGEYWPTRPGPYDLWAIQFGYQEMSMDERKALLEKSTDPNLTFGNDADDMRSPGKAIDPRVNINDMSSDAIEYSIERIQLTEEVSAKLLKKYQGSKAGNSYQELLYSYYILTYEQANAGHTISRYIGGVYVDRSVVGQTGGSKPFIPVDAKDQKKAMQALNEYIFAEDAFSLPDELYNYLARQRRGFNFMGNNEDPKIHARVLRMQTSVLNHLLHENTLNRIVDSKLYGNKYNIDEMMTDLNRAIFDSDIDGNVNAFRQNLQMAYTKMLIEILKGKKSDKYPSEARSMALYNLKKIRSKTNAQGEISSVAHKQHLQLLIDNTFKEIK